MALHYLTVQDILWINLQVTKKAETFDHVKLEEAAFYQYAYGESNSLVPQAARFLVGFRNMASIDVGNEATGFIAFAAFLRLNGLNLTVSDADCPAWLAGIQSRDGAEAAIESSTSHDDHAHHDLAPNVREAVSQVMAAYPKTIEALAAAAV